MRSEKTGILFQMHFAYAKRHRAWLGSVLIVVLVTAFACHSPEPRAAEYPQIELDQPQTTHDQPPKTSADSRGSDAGTAPSDAGATQP